MYIGISTELRQTQQAKKRIIKQIIVKERKRYDQMVSRKEK